jgi:hypothetical protein
MAAAPPRRTAKAEPRHHGSRYRLSIAGDRPWRPIQGDAETTALAGGFDADGRIAAPAGPRIKPGSRLIREWHGRTHTVCVTDEGFEFEGRTYSSLTKVARDITGARWSGPRFFGLTKTPASATSGSDTNGNANSAETISESANG